MLNRITAYVFCFLMLVSFVSLSYNTEGYVNALNAKVYFENYNNWDMDQNYTHYNVTWHNFSNYTRSGVWRTGQWHLERDGHFGKDLVLWHYPGTNMFYDYYYYDSDYLMYDFIMEINWSNIDATSKNSWDIEIKCSGDDMIKLDFEFNASCFYVVVNYLVDNLPATSVMSFTDYNWNTGLSNTTCIFGWVINSQHDVIYWCQVGRFIEYVHLEYYDNENSGFVERHWTPNDYRITNCEIDGDSHLNTTIHNFQIKVGDDFMMDSHFDEFGNMLPMGTTWYSDNGDPAVIPHDSEVANLDRIYDGGITSNIDGCQMWYMFDSEYIDCILNTFTIYVCTYYPGFGDFSAPLRACMLTVNSYGDNNYIQVGYPTVTSEVKKWDKENVYNQGPYRVYRLTWYDMNIQLWDGSLRNSLATFSLHFKINSNKWVAWMAKPNNDDWNGDGAHNSYKMDWTNYPYDYTMRAHDGNSDHDPCFWIAWDTDDGGIFPDNTYSIADYTSSVAIGEDFYATVIVSGGNAWTAFIGYSANRVLSGSKIDYGTESIGQILYKFRIPSERINSLGTYNFYVQDSSDFGSVPATTTVSFSIVANSGSEYVICNKKVYEHGETIYLSCEGTTTNVYEIWADLTLDDGKKDIFKLGNFFGTTGNIFEDLAHLSTIPYGPGTYVFQLKKYDSGFLNVGASWSIVNTSFCNVVLPTGGSNSRGDPNYCTLGWREVDNPKDGFTTIHLFGVCNVQNATLYLLNKDTGSSPTWNLVPGEGFNRFYETNYNPNWKAYVEIDNNIYNKSIIEFDLTGGSINAGGDTGEHGGFINLIGLGIIIGFMVVPIAIFRKNQFATANAGIIMPTFGILGLGCSIAFEVMDLWIAFMFGLGMCILLVLMLLRRF